MIGRLSLTILSGLLVLKANCLGQAVPANPHVLRFTPESELSDKEKIADFSFFFVPGVELDQLHGARKALEANLSGDDLVIANSLVFDVVWSGDVNAVSKYVNSKRHITFTTGLFRYLDDLVAALVMSREFRRPNCAIAYAAYLAAIISYNIDQDRKHQPERDVLIEGVFAAHNLDICPNIPLEQTLYSTPGEYWSVMYQTLMQASVLFVVSHEFAHFRNGDADHPVSYILGDTQSQEIAAAEERRREDRADQFALDFFASHLHAPPLLAVPIMFLAALRTNYDVTSKPLTDHPLTLARVQNMIAASRRLMGAPAVRNWLGDQDDATAIKDSKQFEEYLEQLVK